MPIEKKLLSTLKQHKMSFPRFNLPAQKTCPGSTAICRKVCNAKKAERLWSCVKPFREANLKASKKANFVEKIAEEMKKVKHSFFRLHESGDFYSQEYLEKWFEIAKKFPEIKFLAFTKSFNLDFDKKPSNLQIIFSVMEDSKNIPLNRPIAYAGKENVHNSKECLGYCDKCQICWNLGENESVFFQYH